MEEHRYDFHQRLIDAILLHSSSVDNISLLNGKMGISILFYHLARQTGNTIYEDYAGEMVDQVLDNVNISMSADFSSGLVGIAWYIEYLIQNRWVCESEKDILDDLDIFVFQLDRCRPDLPRFYDDLYGFGLYYLSRAKEDIWNGKILDLIWSDLKSLLLGSLPNDIEFSPDFIVSILYFIKEIKERSFCPSDINLVIAGIPKFVSKNIAGDLTLCEFRYLEILFEELDITIDHLQLNPVVPSSFDRKLKHYGQIFYYEIIFPSIQPPTKIISNSEEDVLSIMKDENTLREILDLLHDSEVDFPFFSIGYMMLILDVTYTANDIPKLQPVSNETVYIFNERSRAGSYGVGTYMSELAAGLQNKGTNIVIIHLDAEFPEFFSEEHDGIRHWYFPSALKGPKTKKEFDEYYRSVVTFLQLRISNTGNIVFHLNFMHNYQLGIYLRKTFRCKILLVVHYMAWTDVLQGNLMWLREILAQPKLSVTNNADKYALKTFKEEKKLLEFVDHVVCLADYACDILVDDYEIDKNKITVVNNGLSDVYSSCCMDSPKILKEKYKIVTNEKIILFAGRLEESKGGKYLIEAFRKVLEYEPNCRLWIVGDGAYNSLFRTAEGIWNRICFTGQIAREQLFELYRMADIGVVPSLFEPFGYVALEMMMHALPVVVTATSGLDEIVEDGISGYKVPVWADGGTPNVDTDMLKQKLVYLLQHPKEREKIGSNGRRRYLNRFTTSIMGARMFSCYQKLLNVQEIA